MKNLRDPLWWKAAFWRAFRTALVIATPYAATLLYDPNVWLVALSTAGFGALTSFVTSLFGIAETNDKATPWWWATTERVVKTAAQAALTLFGASVAFQDVAWAQAPQLIGTAVLGSLLIAFMKGIPEASEPVAAAVAPTIVINEQGQAEIAGSQAVTPVAPASEAAQAAVAAQGDPAPVDGLNPDH